MHPRLPFLAVALVALAACASGPRVKHVKPQLGALPPAPERVQVPLAIRYDPAFSRAWHGLGGRTGVVLIGEDSVAMLDEVAPLVADRLVRVAASPGAAAPADAFVLEPSLEHFDFFGWDEQPGDAHAVVYRMSLFEPGGSLVSTWAVEGRVPFAPETPAAAPQPTQQGFSVGAPEPPPKDGLTHATENLSDAARRFVAGFRRDSRIDAFLARKAAGEMLALGGVAIEAAFQDVAAGLPGVAPTLHGGGLVPLSVRITNRGLAEVRLSGVTARLVLSDGRRLHAPGPRMIARRVQVASATSAGRKAGFGMIGAIAAIGHHTQLRSRFPAFREAIEARALRAGVLAPGASVEGLVYFLPQEGGLPSGGPARLSIWLVDEELRSAHAEVALDLPAPPAPPAPEPASADAT